MELEAGDSGLEDLRGGAGFARRRRHTGDSDQRTRDRSGCRRWQEVTPAVFGLARPTQAPDPAEHEDLRNNEGSDWVLNKRAWIELATIADVAVVWARAPTREKKPVEGFLVPHRYRWLLSQGHNSQALDARASIRCDIKVENVRPPKDVMLPEAEEPQRTMIACLGEARYGIIYRAAKEACGNS